MESVDLGDDDKSTPSRARYSPGQSLGGPENSRRQTQPSLSIEQAARPSFDITVGDPHKVGDITSSHIVYQVRTKVGDVFKLYIKLVIDFVIRPLQKHINSLNSRSAVGTEIFYGYIIPYTTIIQA